jgi:TP901-1 family phage major tail protein
MAAQKGKEILIARDDGAGGHTTIGALRSKRIAFSVGTTDVSDSDSSLWRELLAGANLRSLSVSGQGVLKAAAVEGDLFDDFAGATAVEYELTIPGFKTITGDFIITNYESSGGHEGEVSFSMTLESAGALTIADV